MQRQFATEHRRNIVVGLTALAGLVGLVLLLTAFGYVPALIRSGYEVTVYMDNVSGLRENSRVTLWGREVGEVSEVGFSGPDEPGKTYVKLLIQQRFDVPEDVDVRVETPLFGGGPVVSFVGSTPGAAALVKDGTAQLDSVSVIDPLIQLEQISNNFNTLFGDPDQEDEPSLARVVIGLEDRLVKLERVLDGADAWLNNEQLRSDVNQTAANARELSESLTETVASLEKRYLALAESAEQRLVKVDATIETAKGTLESASSSITEIEKSYVALTDDAAKVIAVIDKLVAQADSKDSTIGLLLSDPQLYQNLTDTSERLKLMTDEARLLIEKWKAEGIPLRVFN